MFDAILECLQLILAPPLGKLEASFDSLKGRVSSNTQNIKDLQAKMWEIHGEVKRIEGKTDVIDPASAPKIENMSLKKTPQQLPDSSNRRKRERRDVSPVKMRKMLAYLGKEPDRRSWEERRKVDPNKPL